MFRKNRNEYGSTDPVLIIVGVAITMIVLVGASFAMSGIITQSSSVTAEGDINSIKTAIDRGLVLKPTADNIKLVKSSDLDAYYIYIWSEGDKNPYKSEPFKLAAEYSILEGTTKDYQVKFFQESLFSSGKYTKTAVSLPDGSNFEQVTLAEEDIVNEQTYSSVTKDFVK